MGIRCGKVEIEAIRGGCPFKDELAGIIAMVRELSGGLETPVLLNELRDFVRQLQRVRVVRGPLMNAVADLCVGSEGSCPLFRIAVLKSMLCASSKYSRGDEQGLFKTTDIASMARGADKTKALLAAEKLLADIRSVATANGLEEPARSAMIGLVDTRVVHHVCGKPDEASFFEVSLFLCFLF